MSYFEILSVRARSLATLRRETGRVNIPFYRVPKVPKHQRVGNIGKGGEDKCPSVENVPPLQILRPSSVSGRCQPTISTTAAGGRPSSIRRITFAGVGHSSSKRN